MTPSLTPTSVASMVKEVRSSKVRVMAKEIALDPALNEGITVLMERMPEMRSPLTALLAGIAAEPKARRVWNETLDEMWAAEPQLSLKTVYPEVVIGSGLHGAIYCATRAAMGMPVPLVLEAESRVGGIFATSHSGGFYLNSRNRPGGLGIPGSQGSLNFLPNAPIQPSEIGFDEYQVNSDLAFAIRAIFAHIGAQIVTDARVYSLREQMTKSGDTYVEVAFRGVKIKADRVIVATGIGEPKLYWGSNERLLSFAQFMRKMDEPFPFRGIGRVAVIGAGDSGKVVIEALTGQGPARHMSVSALDYPTDIVWYGQQQTNGRDFQACNRPRYSRIGTLLNSGTLRERRVTPMTSRVEYVEPAFGSVLVDGQPFDLAIDCTGYSDSNYVLNMSLPDAPFFYSDSEADYYGRYMYGADYGDGENRIFFAGPVSRLPKTSAELRALPRRSSEEAERESLVAAYRYAGRTAMLARSLY